MVALAAAAWPTALVATGGMAQRHAVTIQAPDSSRALPLSADRDLRIMGLRGDVDVVVRGGAVSVSSAECPDQLCVRQGAVSSGSIVCVPNGVAIRVGGDDDALDAYVR